MLKNRSGIAMIMVVGALSVITIVAIGFAFNMEMQYKTSLNYLNGAKARYIAEAGVERALRDLKVDARNSFTYKKNSLSMIQPLPAPPLPSDWVTGGTIPVAEKSFGPGTYRVTAEDEQSKININTASQKLLENAGFTAQQAGDIMAYRAANISFKILEELKKVSSIDEAAYNAKCGLLTVSSYIDPNSSRAPININTASPDILQAVFRDLSNGSVTISEGDAANLADSVKTKVLVNPIEDWETLNGVVKSALSDTAKEEVVKNNCNPNRAQTGLDTTTTTTEFCFFSGGCYTINSTGTIGKCTSRVKAIVKIYEMMGNESTSADFSGGTFTNVNASNAVGAGPIPNSVKIGYYDDFSSNNEWVPSSLLISGALTTNSNDIATLNKNSGKYFLNGTEFISVDVSPRNDGASGFLTLPHTFYAVDGPPPQKIEASVVENKLQLTSVDCAATWDNLRILTKTGSYVTRTYTIPTGAEKPTYTVPYGTVTKADSGDGSDVSLSFAATGADTIQVGADFSNPNLASTAAVLEDIWFTYLPKAKFLYRQEG